MESERNTIVDVMRGGVIILMIMGHIDFGATFSYIIAAFHMPFWFIVSGLFFKYRINAIKTL